MQVKRTNKEYIRIITDGSCLGNPGKGGWAAILQFFKNNSLISEKSISGCSKNTTNNRMEIQALIESLKILKDNSIKYKLDIHTDSMYVVNGLTVYRDSWEYRNFRGVKNLELWRELYKLIDKYKYEINYVKAHTSNSKNSEIEKLNNKVDVLARDKATKC